MLFAKGRVSAMRIRKEMPSRKRNLIFLAQVWLPVHESHVDELVKITKITLIPVVCQYFN